MPATGRSYTGGYFALDLDGVSCGYLKSVEGGGVTAEVVTEKVGLEYYVRKHLGSIHYEDFTLKTGFSNGKALYNWISASWQGKDQRKNGSIIAADFDYKAANETEFFNALLTEVTIPALDASSKEPAYLTIKLTPESTRAKKASGGKLESPAGKTQKQWLPANFRVQIDGLDCTKVSKVDSFTIRQTVTANPLGEARDYEKEPGKLEFPNLKITLAEAAAQTWYDWFENFVIKGNNGPDQEKSGSLALLAPNLQSELAQIRFFNLGIFRLAPDKVEAGSEQIRRVTAELYCERMEFQVSPGQRG